MVKSKKGFRSQAVANQSPETDLMLDGDDDTASLLQEKEMDNLAGEIHKHRCTYLSYVWVMVYVFGSVSVSGQCFQGVQV